MKTATSKSIFAVFIFLISIMLSSAAIAGGNFSVNSEIGTYLDYSVFDEEQRKLIEDNLILGINSNNLGLQISSAYFLGELKSSKAIIPLLKLLRYGKTAEARIIAAISLYKLDSARGMYSIKWYSVHEENEMVKRNFTRIYNTYAVNR